MVEIHDKDQLVRMCQLIQQHVNSPSHQIRQAFMWTGRALSSTGRLTALAYIYHNFDLTCYLQHTTTHRFVEGESVTSTSWTVSLVREIWNDTGIVYRVDFPDEEGIQACERFCQIVRDGGKFQ